MVVDSVVGAVDSVPAPAPGAVVVVVVVVVAAVVVALVVVVVDDEPPSGMKNEHLH